MSISKRGVNGELHQVASYNNTDAILSQDSINPVQNRTIYNALAQKIDRAVDNLINYYLKTDTYNKTEVRQLITSVSTLTIEVVSSLPSSDISTTTIYFLSATQGYDEYVYVNDEWVKIGDTNIDLTDYVTNDGLTLALSEYYDKDAIDLLLENYVSQDNIDGKLDTYASDNTQWDTTPTSGSTKPVTSGGLYSMLAPRTTNISGATVTQSVGSINSMSYTKTGHVVELIGNLDGATITNSSSSTLVITLPSSVPRPMTTGYGTIAFWNSHIDAPGYMHMTSNGQIFLYASNIQANSYSDCNIWFGITYITAN